MIEENTDQGRQPPAAPAAPTTKVRAEPTQSSDSSSGAGPGTSAPKGGGNGGVSSSTRKGGALAGFSLLVSLLVAAGAAGGGYWLWQQDRHLQTQQSRFVLADSVQQHLQPLQDRLSALSDQFQQLSQRSAAPAEQTVAGLDKSLETLKQGQTQAQQQLAKLQQANAELRQTENMLNQRFEALARDKRAAWAESEAGYLAFVAENRVRFYGDVDSALAALKKADELLADLGGETIEARRGIARAVDSLLAVKPLPRVKIDHALAGLVERVGQLPLAVGPTTEPAAITPVSAESGQGWRVQLGHAWHELRDSLSKLVVVARDRKVVPLVTPQQRFFLHQNLTLQLEAARIAALRGDQALYHKSLDQVREWLGIYFDPQSASVNDAIREVGDLADQQVSTKLPDIGPMLASVERLGLRSAQ